MVSTFLSALTTKPERRRLMKSRSKLIQVRGINALLAETAGKTFGTLETREVYGGEDKVTSAWLPQTSFAERIGWLHQLRKIIWIVEMGWYYLTAGFYPSNILSWGHSDSHRNRSTQSEYRGHFNSWWTVRSLKIPASVL